MAPIQKKILTLETLQTPRFNSNNVLSPSSLKWHLLDLFGLAPVMNCCEVTRRDSLTLSSKATPYFLSFTNNYEYHIPLFRLLSLVSVIEHK